MLWILVDHVEDNKSTNILLNHVVIYRKLDKVLNDFLFLFSF